MTKIIRCDKCGKEIRVKVGFKITDDFVMCRIFTKSQKQGGNSSEYHLCKICAKKEFGLR